LLQLARRRGYPIFFARPPWTLGLADECALPLRSRTARVLRFTLHHPAHPTQWGVAAFWLGRPDDGYLALLGLGPDPSISAEVLLILRDHQP
jgi:hypothetical protein